MSHWEEWLRNLCSYHRRWLDGRSDAAGGRDGMRRKATGRWRFDVWLDRVVWRRGTLEIVKEKNI